MKKYLFTIILASLAIQGQSQVDGQTAIVIGNDSIPMSEFTYFLSKQKESGRKSRKQFLGDFIGMQLKVTEARHLGLNTTKDFGEKTGMYYKHLLGEYLFDPEPGDSLLKVYFNRIGEIRDISVFEIFKRWVPSEQDYLDSESELRKIREKLRNSNYPESGSLDSLSRKALKFRRDIGFNQANFRYEEAAFNTLEGMISEICRSQYYAYFVYVHEVKPVSAVKEGFDTIQIPEFEQVEGTLKEMYLMNKEREKHLRFRYLEQLKRDCGFNRHAESFVRFYETYGPGGFSSGKWVAGLMDRAVNDTLFTLGKRPYTHADFFRSLENRQYAYNLRNYKAYLSKYYLEWEENELIGYLESHLREIYPSVDMKMKEFEYTELILSALEKVVWPEAMTDTADMYQYYTAHPIRYGIAGHENLVQRYAEVKSKVRIDYLAYVEERWTEELRKKYKVHINRKALR